MDEEQTRTDAILHLAQERGFTVDDRGYVGDQPGSRTRRFVLAKDGQTTNFDTDERLWENRPQELLTESANQAMDSIDKQIDTQEV